MAPPCISYIAYGPEVTDFVMNGANPLLHVGFTVNAKSQITSKPVRAMDGTQVKWTEHTLTAESVIYVPHVSNPEAEVQRIRDILNTPGNQLYLSASGLGAFPTINVSTADPTNGPHPSEVLVQPFVSNEAIFIRWTVTFCTTTCPSIGDGGRIVNLSARMTMEIDEDGDAILSAEGEIEFEKAVPLFYTQYLLTIDDPPSPPADPDTLYVQRGYTWKATNHIEPNGRTIKYRAITSPIKSDNAYFASTRTVDITQEISSNLLGKSIYDGKGFYTWRNTFSGDITLPPGVHKSWAWSVFLRVLRQRNRRLVWLDEKLVGKVEGTSADASVTKKKPYMLPLKVKIRDPIYSRKMSFQVDYMVVSDLDHILHSTGIFYRVNNDYPGKDILLEGYTPGELSDQWKEWQTDYNNYRNILLYRARGTPIVFNCGQAVPNQRPVFWRGQTREEGDELDPDWYSYQDYSEEQAQVTAFPPGFQKPNPLQPEISWGDYSLTLEVYENTRTVPIVKMTSASQAHYNTTEAQAKAFNAINTGSTKWNLHSAYPVDQAASRSVSYRGPANYTIRMLGNAIRVGYPIFMPTICSVGSDPAIRTGVPRFMHRQVSQSSHYPVYMAAWDVSYLLTGDMADNVITSIKSNGFPGQFI